MRTNALLTSLALAASVTALGSQANAQQVQTQCFTANVTLQSTNWNNTMTFPKFDPAVGHLVGIDFTLSASALGSIKVESLDAAPSVVTTNLQAQITLTRPDLSVIVVTLPTATFTDNLAAFDGTIDFAGASGTTHANITASDSDSVSSPPPASDLVLFQGPAFAPGTISLPVGAAGTSSGSGAGNLVQIFNTSADASCTVCYRYLPRIWDYCHGDGSQNGGLDCPCNNNNPGIPGGCINQFGAAGLLVATGFPLISNDTFTLTMTNIPPSGEAWFFQGQQRSEGVLDGHGIRCLRGPVLRMQKVGISGNVVPAPGFPPLSVQYGYAPGDVVQYQGYFRQPNDVCGGPINYTNAVQAIWGP